MRYAVYVSGKGTRIKKAIETIDRFAEKVKLIISDDANNLYLEEFMQKRGIDYVLIDYKKIELPRSEKNEYLSDRINELLEVCSIDYCFSFGGHILKGKLLENYKWKIINFHPAILPMFPGVNAIDNAMANGARYIGNTAHFIDSGVDTGPIILQNITLAENFLKYGYDEILDEQLVLIEKIDRLLCENRVKVVNGSVEIEGADYRVSAVYPKVD